MQTELPLIPHSRPSLVAGMEEAAQALVRSGQHAGGALRRELEASLSERIGHPHAIAVNSGFAALHLALLSYCDQPQFKSAEKTYVLVPSYVCASILHAVDAAGAHPVIADVDRGHFNLTADFARQALEREALSESDICCAIMPHILGSPAPVAQWDLAIPVIEDCAMALGAKQGGSALGSHSDISIFSFYATKMISTAQGGAVLLYDLERAQDLRDRLQYDNRPSWRPCWNYQLSDLAACIGLPQLEALDSFVAKRQEIAKSLLDFCQKNDLATQEHIAGGEPNCFRFVILLKDAQQRVALQEELALARIESKSPVFRPLHDYLAMRDEDFANTVHIQERALSLPIYPSLTDPELERILAALNKFMCN